MPRQEAINFALTDIPLDDGNTFDLLSRGDTVGVFQLEGGGMTRYIKELKPSSLSDVAAMIALYRPGPMEHISTFIDSKHGRVAPHYPHPALQDILEETYGVIVYQDQVLQIARTFAGYSLGQADIVRKAMGKKIPEIMAEEKQNFLAGALNQGYTRQMAEQIFALIEPFAGYAFNKAHSVSYGLISYWTAYLKSNFPAEYMVALLNSYKDNTDRVAGAVAECRRMNINVLPPSINGSEVNFSIDTGEQGDSAIRFGLSAIKNVGEAAVAPLIETRKEMDGFRSIEQLCQNADLGGVGKKALESLIRAGAFDDFGDRSGMLEVIDRIVSLAQSEAHLRNSQQTSMFDMMGDSMPAELASIDIPDLNTSDAEKGQWEQELLRRIHIEQRDAESSRAPPRIRRYTDAQRLGRRYGRAAREGYGHGLGCYAPLHERTKTLRYRLAHPHGWRARSLYLGREAPGNRSALAGRQSGHRNRQCTPA